MMETELTTLEECLEKLLTKYQVATQKIRQLEEQYAMLETNHQTLLTKNQKVSQKIKQLIEKIASNQRD